MPEPDVLSSESERSPGARLRQFVLTLPRASWPFVALAALDLVLWLYAMTQSFDNSFERYLHVATSVAIVLLPAALFYGAPAAVRANRLLTRGIAGLAVLEVAGTAQLVYGGFVLSTLGDVTWLQAMSLIFSALSAVAFVAYAIGLLRMRQRPLSRVARLLGPMIVPVQLLVPVVLWFVVVGVVPDSMVLIDWLSIGATYLLALSGGLVVWVAVAGWVDREEPRDFWRVLGLAGLIGLAASVLEIIEGFASYADALVPGIADALSILLPPCSLAAAIGAIAAFGWAFGLRRPRTPEPSSAVLPAPATP